ncbi:MAG: molecular chaperone DnaK [Chlamydiia bacterium]|nr:molecular chaperone DnaK [Chlamydiia bacterium]
MSKKYIIGIDLGTTNSCVSVMEGKEPTVIPSQEGTLTIPSVIAYKADEVLVGVAAKRQAVTNPINTLYSTKRFIGRPFQECQSDIKMVPYKVIDEDGPVFNVNGKNVRPEEAAAQILTKMKEIAQSYLGKDAIIDGAVITVPAYFNNTQKQATIDAGIIAGLEVKRIINEPTAAAIAYGLDKKNANHVIAVFDFGGGTFDISILEISDGVVEVKATNGDNHLGGDDIDNILIDHVIDTFKAEQGIDLKKDPMALQRIKESSEKAKKELSGVLNTEIILPFITMGQDGAKHLNMTLSRVQFEEMISPIINRIVNPCETAISKSGINKNQIKVILAVGGSTRIPLVEKVAEKIFGKPMDKGVNPDTIVSLGAAIQAGILSGDVQDLVLLDNLPIAIGLETEGGIFTAIIKEGETIPTANEETFTTASDNQSSVTIRVLQGASDMASRNQEIGRFDLTGIAPAPRGVPQITVKFEVNSNGVLHCSAKDVKTGKEQTAEIVAKNGLSEEVVAQLKAEAEKYREEDTKKKEFIQAKHEAQMVSKQSRDTIKEFGDKISDDLKTEIENSAKNLDEVAEKSSEVAEITTALESTKQILQKVGQSIYGDQSQSQQTAGPDQPQEGQPQADFQEATSETSGNDEIVE